MLRQVERHDHATNSSDPARSTFTGSRPTWSRFWRSAVATASRSSRMRRRRTGPSTAGKVPGLSGFCGCFSFYPGKNLGAYGEAGAVVTDDDQVADRLRSLRDHAQSRRYHHAELGFNYRMDGFQGPSWVSSSSI